MTKIDLKEGQFLRLRDKEMVKVLKLYEECGKQRVNLEGMDIDGNRIVYAGRPARTFQDQKTFPELRLATSNEVTEFAGLVRDNFELRFSGIFQS